MKPEKNIVDFYIICATLADTIRAGWAAWRVPRARLESVAEHVFGVQMLAIAMWSEYKYENIDIRRVIMMIALHELEESVIGDLTQWDINPDEKVSRGHAAVKSILGNLAAGDELEKLILEFDARETPDALFAYHCDKLQADITAKLYDTKTPIDLTAQNDNPIFHDRDVQKLFATGKSFGDMWMQFGRDKYGYDKNFTAVSEYAEHNISKS
ncbi:MAG: HD domain-containing protein [Rickettsiales bacterium]|jgi:putative hydrolase of HD superfamily|nr:HD domain-containing protein [Rickettsiales bacterium]